MLALTAMAAIDVWRQKVYDSSLAVLAVVAVLALHHDHISAIQWMWAGLCALTAFLFYLELGAHGQIGGGDVKLAAIPAAVFGAVNPLIAIWWVTATIAAQSVVGLIDRRSTARSVPSPLPHVPAMAITSVLAGSVLLSAIT
jgi:Flp pilus assembly protein protease CpaA